MQKKHYHKRLSDYLGYWYVGILGLLAFHAFFTTWLGSMFGHLDAWRIWKELAIVVSIPFVLYAARSNAAIWAYLRSSVLIRLIVTYMTLVLVVGYAGWARGVVEFDALAYGYFVHLRYVGFFLLLSVVARLTSIPAVYAVKTVLAGAGAVLIFGVMQILLLPYDFLRHFGYGSTTIPAYHTVDSKLEYIRIQSFLRGPNPLGAYLVVVMSLLVVRWKMAKIPRERLLYMAGLLLGAWVLYASYSRSAEIGALIAIAVIAFVFYSRKITVKVALLLVVVLLTCTISLIALRNNNYVQNVVFHSDEMSRSSISSNESRTNALSAGLKDVYHEPLGRGVGTAGPASFRNDGAYPRISENYYLQLAQEVGVVGMALFIAIMVVIGRELWKRKQDPLCLALVASFIAISWINLVSHAWADDTLGLLWWGLAAIALAERPHTGRKKQLKT